MEVVATALSTIPRVKPEASANARRATGSMGSILTQDYRIMYEDRPKTAEPPKGG